MVVHEYLLPVLGKLKESKMTTLSYGHVDTNLIAAISISYYKTRLHHNLKKNGVSRVLLLIDFFKACRKALENIMYDKNVNMYVIWQGFSEKIEVLKWFLFVQHKSMCLSILLCSLRTSTEL